MFNQQNDEFQEHLTTRIKSYKGIFTSRNSSLVLKHCVVNFSSLFVTVMRWQQALQKCLNSVRFSDLFFYYLLLNDSFFFSFFLLFSFWGGAGALIVLGDIK